MSFSGFFRRASSVASSKQTRSAPPSGARFHCHQTDNNSLALTRTIPIKDFGWIMTGSSWITEAQTYYLISDKGQFIFMQIAFSNLSWPAQTSCQVSVRYTELLDDMTTNKDKVIFVTSHAAANKMKVSHDKTSVEVKSVKYLLTDPKSDDSPEFQLECDDEKLKIRISFSPLIRPFSILDGNLHFGLDRSDGHINLKFMPFAAVTGVVDADGVPCQFDGYGFCVHQFQGVKPYLSASKWNVVYFQQADASSELEYVSAFMIQIKTPSSYDSTTYNIGSIFAGGKHLGVSIRNKIEEEELIRDSESHYMIPARTKFTWEGVTFDKEPFNVTCEVTAKNLCVKQNVLETLPYFIRRTIEAFVTRPYAYYWLDEGELVLNIGDHTSVVKGWIMQELSLINEE